MPKRESQTVDHHHSRFAKHFAKPSRSFVNTRDKRDVAYKTARWKAFSVYGCVYSIYTQFDRMPFHTVIRELSVFEMREIQTFPVCPFFASDNWKGNFRFYREKNLKQRTFCTISWLISCSIILYIDQISIIIFAGDAYSNDLDTCMFWIFVD